MGEARRGPRCRSSVSRPPHGTASRALAAGALFLAVLAACTSTTPFQKEAQWPEPACGAITTEHPLATRIGLSVLERGGNAADAAVATALALAVVYPQAGNLGGGGFALWVPHTGPAVAIDFRETAPAAADPELFLGRDGTRVPERSLAGPLAVAVPGSPAGLYELWERFGSGRFSLADLALPAITHARIGIPVDAWLARDLESPAVRARMNAAARELFYPGGLALGEGDTLRQPELAETLAAFAATGPQSFYLGRIAEAIVAELEASAVPDGGRDGGRDGELVFGAATGRGWITAEDLAGYRTRERVPLRGWFRGMEIVTMPPPSSGGIVALQVLGVLEGLPLDAERTRSLAAHELERSKAGAADPTAAGDDPGLDERLVHWWIEALRRGFADRAAWLGDPDFVSIPVRELLSSDAIASRRISIGETAAVSEGPALPPREGGNTTHLSVLDRQGNAVSLTTTLNTNFGSGILVRQGGFLLNNEIDDFAIQPGAPNHFGLVGGAANALAPGRRPLSSMMPTVVRDGGNATIGVLGSPDGPRIISSLVQVLLRVLVLEQGIEDAIRAPRLHQQWSPPETTFERGFEPTLIAALENRRGHRVRVLESLFGSVQAVWLSELGARPVAVSDARRGGNGGVEGQPPSAAARPPLR